MPKYEYLCETNGQTIEVNHSMSESLNNWGELCNSANLEPGETPPDAPVKRIISGGIFLSPKTAQNSSPKPASKVSQGSSCSCC